MRMESVAKSFDLFKHNFNITNSALFKHFSVLKVESPVKEPTEMLDMMIKYQLNDD